MKRFLAIMLAVFMLVPLFVFGTSAAEVEPECTYQRKNIAALSTITVSSPVWMVDASYLVDGDVTKGTAANSGVDLITYTLEFEEANVFDEIVLVVNGKGQLPASYQGFDEFSNNDYPITLKLYNGENEVYSLGPVQTIDRVTLSTSEDANFEPTSATKIVVEIQNDYKNDLAALWEIETYSGSVGSHLWEESETVESDCKTAGHVDYACSCGATKTEDLPLSETHAWDNGTVKTPAGEATDGVKEYVCTICGDKREVTIPATEHTAFDEGVVTAPTCIEAGYTTYTCTHCNTYTYKDNYVDALGHDLDEGTPVIRQTFTTEGKTVYECERNGCDYSKEVIIPAAQYEDNRIAFDDETTTITETVTAEKRSAYSSTEIFFDGILCQDAWATEANSNYWGAPSGSSLKVEFKYDYIMTTFRMNIWSNTNSFKVEFFDSNNQVVLSKEQKDYGNTGEGSQQNWLDYSSELRGKSVKYFVITIVSSKYDGAGLRFCEMDIKAHDCLYDEDDKANKVEEASICKTTFDGTCWMCGATRTGVEVYNHTYAQENGADKVEIDTPNSCYANGAGHKTCTVCSDVEEIFLPATGNHDFENGQEVYDEKPTCGEAGTAHKLCATEGCTATSEVYDVSATGNHSNFNWKALEGQESDYTHEGVEGYLCGVCGYQDESKGTRVAAVKSFSCVATKDWSIRYTGFTSPKATFKINLKNIEKVEDEYSVKVFGVVKKGDVVKEVQVYGEGATGKMMADGTFSLVVQGGSYTDEYEFSVRVEITDKEDNTTASSVTKAKPMTTSTDGIISAYDVAFYYLDSESRASNLDSSVKAFYETIVASNEQ